VNAHGDGRAVTDDLAGGRPLIVTVTPNPSLDRTLEVESLLRGEVVRAHASRTDPGGKGVNVSRALVANGHRSRAVLPLGGPDGEVLAALLEGLGIEVAAVPIADAVRSNVTVVEPDGTVTKVNAPGPQLSSLEVEALVARAVDAAQGAAWVVASGSLAPGMPSDLYARLGAAVDAVGARFAVDSSGPALGAVLGAHPDLLKPNEDELSEVTGSAPRTVGEVLLAAEELRAGGVGTVLVSLGATGAVLIQDGQAVHAESEAVVPRSTVGAGDALLAGFLAAGGEGPAALAEGVAWGAAACVLPGTAVPGPDDLRRDLVRTHAVDPAQPVGSGGTRSPGAARA
jgi:1-phosphofructokinase